jgi:hypothetical protein
VRAVIAQRLRKRRTLAAGVAALLLAGAAIAAVAVFPLGASASSPSSVRALDDSGLPPVVERAVAAAATRAGIDRAEVRQVTAHAAGRERAGIYDSAGLYVARNVRGEELVSFFSPASFTSFTDTRRITRINGGIFASAASQPDADGATGHVQLMGVADPAVERVEIERADRTAVPIELARLPRGRFSYFTYVSDDPGTFPRLVRAFGSSGEIVAQQDVSEDIKPPSD